VTLRSEPAAPSAIAVETPPSGAGTHPGRRVLRVSDGNPSAPLHRLDPNRLGDHVDRLFRAAWALCGRREDAEDLVQETYALVLARPRWLRRDDDLGYLLRVLRNAHVSRRRASGRRPAEVPLDDHAEAVSHLVEWDPEAAIEAGALFAAIAQLPAAFREALVAVDVVGLSYREAGAALGVRESTITTRLHRARARVASELARPSTVTHA
jgi:RNA polymerase sigma-70 factor, ECF subfamily